MSERLLDRLLQQPDFTRKSRLRSLFSDFSPLAMSNKDGFDANINAWINALNGALMPDSGDGTARLCITTDKALADDLTSSQWGRPLALSAVESEAKSRKIWVPLDTFMSQEDPIDHIPGMFEKLTLGTALRWGASKLWTKSPAKDLTGTTYVSIPNVEAIAGNVITTVSRDLDPSYSGHITTMPLLQRSIQRDVGYKLTDEDMAVLVRYMQRDKQAISMSKDIVKFHPTSSKATCLQEISETDIAVANVKSTLNTIDSQIETLTQKIDASKDAISAALAKNQKSIALGLLKSRKLAEATLTARLESQSQLSQILTRIDDAAMHVGIVEALESGSTALSGLLSQVGGIERVDRVLDRVQTQMDETEEIGEALRGVGQRGDEALVDEQVEAEWREMVEAQEREKGQHEKEQRQQQEQQQQQQRVKQEKAAASSRQDTLTLPDAPTLSKAEVERGTEAADRADAQGEAGLREERTALPA